jgi:hypothetical protein
MKSIAIVLLAALTVSLLASADDYTGNAKGPDDPRAEVVGENQSLPVLALSGQKSMDLGNQALGKTGLAVISLSGTDPAVFGQFAFAKDGVGDGGSYGAWKPGI